MAKMIFRLTRKLATKLGVEPAPSLPPDGSFLHDWTANLFVAGRVQYFIVTNTSTLYSAVIHGRGNTGAYSFIENVLADIGEILRLDGLSSIFTPMLADPVENTSFRKASDGRVLGSVNDFVFGAKVFIISARLPLPEVSCLLNQTPMKLIKYSVPCDHMRKLLVAVCRPRYASAVALSLYIGGFAPGHRPNQYSA
jgi:hypothetical protein